MATILLNLQVEITDEGTVRITGQSGWTMRRDPQARGPLTPDEITRIVRAVEGEGSLALSADSPARSQFSLGKGPEEPMKTERPSLAKKIADSGWLQLDEVDQLIKHCGVSRVHDVSNWIARKIAQGEIVRAPGALLRSTCLRGGLQPAR